MIALLFILALPLESQARFDAVLQGLPAMDRARRGALPMLTPALVRLGPSALQPMLAALKRPPPPGLTSTAARGLRLSLIEATGMLRDPSALPVLFNVLDGADDFDTARLAAEAIGRLGTDAARDKLLSSTQREGVLAGMGQCRRVAIAVALDRALDGLAPFTAKQIVRALSDVGNAAGWRLAKAHRDEEALTRATAAAALVRAFVTYADEETRTAASNAIMVVDAPETTGLIVEARRLADGETAAALDELAARFQNNPTR